MGGAAQDVSAEWGSLQTADVTVLTCVVQRWLSSTAGERRHGERKEMRLTDSRACILERAEDGSFTLGGRRNCRVFWQSSDSIRIEGQVEAEKPERILV